MTTEFDSKQLLKLTFLGKVMKVQELFNLYPNLNINVRDPEGRTPLIMATLQENLTLICLFIVKGANVNACDMYGKNALMYAQDYKFKGAIKFLTTL